METASTGSRSEGENIHDKYEILEYFVGKIDSQSTPREMYAFLLEFLQVIVGDRKETVPGCVFVVNEESGDFEPLVMSEDGFTWETFESQRDRLVDAGIVPWCITNKRLAFSEARQAGLGKNCIVIPLFTGKRMLGFALLFTNRPESGFSRATIKIINISCLQTCLSIDIAVMYDQLKKAQSRMIQSEKFSGIGQLAAGIAHEINNPVGFVLSNSSTLGGYVGRLKQMIGIYRTSVVSEEIRAKENELKIDMIVDDLDELIRENLEGLRRIAEIVQAMKNFTRIDQRHEHAKSDINQGLRSALLMARNEIKYRAEVKTDYGDLPPVDCNIGELNQVFLNVLVNAAQAIAQQHRSGKGNITVKTRSQNNWVLCEISDDGPGIPADVLPKIFDPFFTTKPVGAGTGLGLSIAYDIVVNRHRGDIEVQSVPGKGATFVIRLPVDRTILPERGPNRGRTAAHC